MPEESAELEHRRIRSVAKEYRDKGYRVTIEPSPEELPLFLKGLRPDLIAEGKDETVVVEVKSAVSLLASEQLERLAEAVEGRPGWRLELVVTNPRGSSEVPIEGELVGPNVIERRLREALNLAEANNLEAAMLLAWSAAEATLRHIAEREEISLERRDPSYATKALYSYGALSDQDYQILDVGRNFRNAVAHGFTAKDLTQEAIHSFINTTMSLLEDVRSGGQGGLC